MMCYCNIINSMNIIPSNSRMTKQQSLMLKILIEDTEYRRYRILIEDIELSLYGLKNISNPYNYFFASISLKKDTTLIPTNWNPIINTLIHINLVLEKYRLNIY